MGHRSRAVAITAGLALLALVALFWLMEQLASLPVSSETTSLIAVSPLSQPVETNTSVSPRGLPNPSPSSNPTPSEPLATPASTVIARVNDAAITQDEWRVALLLDGVMSQLSQQPPPSAEETLQRLINERLALHAAQLERSPLPISEAEARIRQIQDTFGISDQRLSETLASHGLRWVDLTHYTARLVLVERAIEILRARYGDFDRWLTQARADASIVVYPTNGISLGRVDISPTRLLEATSTPTAETVQKGSHLAQEIHPVAPDFTLSSAQGMSVTLSDYRQRATVVLVFYRGQT
ncbi:MAG: hypothetical protein DDG58_06480 [Ardenticatenia bacterium]|jgi:hypothetical protein|nr:MAG: hypothetical protein DDG58_06480 [Ardenticatenia bacterium]